MNFLKRLFYFSLYGVGGILASSLLETFFFYEHPKFKDVYCKVGKGMIFRQQSRLSCVTQCSTTTNCKGVFFNNVTSTCSVMHIVSIPGYECRQQPGSRYYFKNDTTNFEPYNFTSSDLARLENETIEEICLSYPYHSLNTDVDGESLGCGDSICCLSKGCYTGDSENYTGTWSVSVQGIPCQRWDSQEPHAHYQDMTDAFPDASLSDAQNYCRDPDHEGFMWCYTMDEYTRWETCDIPACP